MGIFDRFHGHVPESHHAGAGPPWFDDERLGSPPSTDLSERQAIARYRNLLWTAPPETIEQAHAAAFAQLTAGQRHLVFAELCHDAPAFEWESGRRFGDDVHSLARMATRAELEHPGTLERAFGRIGSAETGFILVGATGGTFLGGIASGVVGSWPASQFFAETSRGERLPGETSDADLLLDHQAMPPRTSMDDN